MRIATVAVPLLTVFWVSPSAAYHQVLNVSDSPTYSRDCAVACSPYGVILVAWKEVGGGIWSRFHVGDAFLDPVFHGLGEEPAVRWTGEAFVLAYADEWFVRVWEGDQAGWVGPDSMWSEFGYGAWSPDLADVPGSPGDAYLVWASGYDDYPVDTAVWFTMRSGGTWDDPELVSAFAGAPDWALPKVEPISVMSNVCPRVYALAGDYYLHYMERVEGTWHGPYEFPMGYGGSSIDAAPGPSLTHSVLIRGPLAA